MSICKVKFTFLACGGAFPAFARPVPLARGLSALALALVAGCAEQTRTPVTGGTAGTDTAQPTDSPGADPVSQPQPAEPESADSADAADSLPADSLPADSLPPDSLEAEAPEATLPPGTLLPALADWELSTQDHREGDPVIVSFAEDITDARGLVLIPEGSKLLGRVTFVASSLGRDEVPVLEVAFETVSTETYERPVQAVLVELNLRPAPEREVGGLIPGVVPAGTPLLVEVTAPLRLPLPIEAEEPDSASGNATGR